MNEAAEQAAPVQIGLLGAFSVKMPDGEETAVAERTITPLTVPLCSRG